MNWLETLETHCMVDSESIGKSLVTVFEGKRSQQKLGSVFEFLKSKAFCSLSIKEHIISSSWALSAFIEGKLVFAQGF